jgi:hypothetical protein
MTHYARHPSVPVRGLLAVALAAAPLSAQEAPGTIVGLVVARESGEPLAHTVVAVPSLEIRRFSSDSGTFVFRDLPEGLLVIHVRRLGYAPKELTVDVRAGSHDSLRVELTRVAVKLAAVQVLADPPCTAPGLRAVKDSALATVLTQLRMNGEQYRLLAEAYPFVYSHERTVTTELKSGDTRVDVIDTAVVQSKTPWRYLPGRVLTRVGGRHSRMLYFNIPTLPDFADPLFLDNHCFADGGIDHVDGSELIRIDMVAWARIKNPDVNGSIFLDPSTFQIRRSVLRLSRSPKVSGLTGVEVTTLFQEALASIPIVAQISAVQRYDARGKQRDFVTAYEYHRLISFRFVGARPGDDPTP